MAQLPQVKGPDDVAVILPRWKSQLDPILKNLLVSGQQITGVRLDIDPVIVQHSLGRVPIGWILSDLDSNEQVYRTLPMTNKTVTLVASGECVVNLWIY